MRYCICSMRAFITSCCAMKVWLNSNEPFKSLLCQGMVLAESFYKDNDGRKQWLYPSEVTVERDAKGRTSRPLKLPLGEEVHSGGITKMSKSKNNGVDPQTAIDKHGADTVRLFTMFAAPPEQTLEWSNDGVAGAHRFLRKLWTMVHSHLDQAAAGGNQLSWIQNRSMRVTKICAAKPTKPSTRSMMTTVAATPLTPLLPR